MSQRLLKGKKEKLFFCWRKIIILSHVKWVTGEVKRQQGLNVIFMPCEGYLNTTIQLSHQRQGMHGWRKKAESWLGWKTDICSSDNQQRITPICSTAYISLRGMWLTQRWGKPDGLEVFNCITRCANTVFSHQPVPYHDEIPSHSTPQIPGISQVWHPPLPSKKHVRALSNCNLWSPRLVNRDSIGSLGRWFKSVWWLYYDLTVFLLLSFPCISYPGQELRWVNTVWLKRSGMQQIYWSSIQSLTLYQQWIKFMCNGPLEFLFLFVYVQISLWRGWHSPETQDFSIICKSKSALSVPRLWCICTSNGRSSHDTFPIFARRKSLNGINTTNMAKTN